MVTTNLLMRADSYKWTHWNMLPVATERVFSYLEARPSATHEALLWYGALQYYLREYLEGVRVTKDDIAEAETLQRWHFNGPRFNREGWEIVLRDHGGRLPVRICAAPEGLVIPSGNVLLTIENTDPRVPWLTNFLETLLMKAWYPATVATRSYYLKLRLARALRLSGEDEALAEFMLQDFGYRGVSSEESAAIGASAHLVSFRGTDTVTGLLLPMKYYGATSPGFSVAASEHSIMTALGRTGETSQAMHVLAQHANQIVSMVADSYDYYAFVDKMIAEKPFIDRNGIKLVIRPDSLTPTHRSPSDLVLWTLQRIAGRLGYKETTSGHKVVPYMVLWGDGLDPDEIVEILTSVVASGFAASNLVFGMGGQLLQAVTRDTESFALKCSAQFRDGVWVDVAKDPLDGRKKSKAGRLALVRDDDGGYATVREEELRGRANVLQPIFENGVVLRQELWSTIRERQHVDIEVALR